MYHAARIVGECVRRVSEIDRASLERDSFSFNVNLLLGGQVRGEEPALYLIYPQGNPLQATEDSPYLQLGECKYGRPILDRGIDMRRPRWRSPPSTRCCRSTRRCARTSPSGRRSTC